MRRFWSLLAWGAPLLAATLTVWWVILHRPTGQPSESRFSPTRLILRRGIGPEPESLDPHRARSEAALGILRDLYEGLTEVGPNGTAVLAAADRCDISTDGKTYRFHLRPGARWSNGEPLNAEDFVAAWRRLVDPHTGAQYAQLLAPVRGATAITQGHLAALSLGARAASAAILVVELEHPSPYFLSVLAHPATFPINRTSWRAHGVKFAKPGFMVSNGAFTLSGWDFGSHVIARRNPYYWNAGQVRLDGVEYYSMPEAATELRAYRSGELDVTSTVPAAQFTWIKQHQQQELHIAPQLAVYYLGLNLKRAPFDRSQALRTALSMVIDRERLVRSITGMGESPAYGLVPSQTFGYSSPLPQYAHWSMQTRVLRARALLRAAGLLQSPPKIELRYNSGDLHSRIAIAVARMWQEYLGIETTLRAEEFKILLQDIDRGNTQVFRASWIADYNDAYSFLQLLQSGFGINLPGYSNSDYDALLARANQTVEIGERRALLQQAEALMIADQPLIPLYFYVASHLVSPTLSGWSDNVMNVVYSKALTKEHP